MNDFDRTARRAVRDDPEGHARWWLPNLPAGLRCLPAPLESQCAPRPGEPDRRCDTILELVHEGGLGVPWAVVCELFTASDADALDRLGEYIFRFRRELRHGPHGHDRYRWAGALVFLTGGPEQAGVEDTLPGGDSVLCFAPKVVRLADQDAVATMAAIRENRLSASALAWVPLMAGGVTTECVTEWRAVAETCVELDSRRRELAVMALVFAELTECIEVWRTGLEGFAVLESTLLKRERVESRREMLVHLLRARYKDELPAVVVERIQVEGRPEELDRLAAMAVTADLAAIRAAVGA